MTDVSKLANALDLIAKKCPNGLKALLGQAEKPSWEQLKETLWKASDGEIVSVAHSVNTDKLANEAIQMVEVFGVLDGIQWDQIITAVRWYSQNALFVRDWRIYCDYVAAYGLPRSYGCGTLTDILAEKHDTTPRTIRRICKRVPLCLAEAASRGTGGLQLSVEWS